MNDEAKREYHRKYYHEKRKQKRDGLHLVEVAEPPSLPQAESKPRLRVHPSKRVRVLKEAVPNVPFQTAPESLKSKSDKGFKVSNSVSNRFETFENGEPLKPSGVSWTSALFALALLLVSAVLTAFLVSTAQGFYARSTGPVWGWLLAGAFEVVILILAIYRPEGTLSFKSFSTALAGVPFAFRWLASRAALLALAVYSYQVVTVNIDEDEAKATEVALLASPAQDEIRVQSAYRDSLLKALEDQRKGGALGAYRATQIEIERLSERISNLRKEVSASQLTSKKHAELKTTRACRLLALIVNIVLGHLLGTMARRGPVSRSRSLPSNSCCNNCLAFSSSPE